MQFFDEFDERDASSEFQPINLTDLVEYDGARLT